MSDLSRAPRSSCASRCSTLSCHVGDRTRCGGTGCACAWGLASSKPNPNPNPWYTRNPEENSQAWWSAWTRCGLKSFYLQHACNEKGLLHVFGTDFHTQLSLTFVKRYISSRGPVL